MMNGTARAHSSNNELFWIFGVFPAPSRMDSRMSKNFSALSRFFVRPGSLLRFRYEFALYSMQALSVLTVRYDLAECLLYCNYLRLSHLYLHASIDSGAIVGKAADIHQVGTSAIVIQVHNGGAVYRNDGLGSH